MELNKNIAYIIIKTSPRRDGSIMHHSNNIEVVYKIPRDSVSELGKVPGKIYNVLIDDWDEVDESGKWKRYTQSDPMIWKCKCCQTSYAMDCSCRYKMPGEFFTIEVKEQDVNCKHTDVDFICKSCKGIK